jgi:hypothetical protein
VEDQKIYQYSKDLENFFELQLRKLLPKYAKSLNPKLTSNLGAMSFQDFIDMDDPDYMPSNNPKRKRSTPSI